MPRNRRKEVARNRTTRSNINTRIGQTQKRGTIMNRRNRTSGSNGG